MKLLDDRKGFRYVIYLWQEIEECISLSSDKKECGIVTLNQVGNNPFLDNSSLIDLRVLGRERGLSYGRAFF